MGGATPAIAGRSADHSVLNSRHEAQRNEAHHSAVRNSRSFERRIWTISIPCRHRRGRLASVHARLEAPLEEMKDSTSPRSPQWSTAPSAKTKNVVQRSVTALLDALAPERVLKRVEQLQGAVEQYRTPTGCLLQAATCAVSVSWFPNATKDAVLGELHILVWRGKVARRGIPRSPKNATLVAELVLRPIEPPADDCIWQATDGARYDTASLAAHVLSLLEAQSVDQG